MSSYNESLPAPVFTLSTGVLNDDIITVTSQGIVVVYYTYATEWSDHKHIERFDSVTEALDFYRKTFGARLDSEAQYLSEVEGEDTTTEDLVTNIAVALHEWEEAISKTQKALATQYQSAQPVAAVEGIFEIRIMSDLRYVVCREYKWAITKYIEYPRHMVVDMVEEREWSCYHKYKYGFQP